MGACFSRQGVIARRLVRPRDPIGLLRFACNDTQKGARNENFQVACFAQLVLEGGA